MTLPQPSSQQQSQHFLLKWNNHRSNMVNVFESLLQSENLVDVTIAVEGKFLKAHKIVLSACSPYFESMFVSQTPSEKHPILIFHDMKYAHLKTLLDFMYRGEISIDERDLSDVLKVAEALSIRGLSSFESDDEDSEKSSEPPGPSSSNSNSNNNNNNNNNNSNAANNTPNTSNSFGESSESSSYSSPPSASSTKGSKGQQQNGPSSATSSSATTSSSANNEASSSKGNAHSFNNHHNFPGSPVGTTGQNDNHNQSSGKSSACDSGSGSTVKVKKDKSSSKANGVGKKSSVVVRENNVPATSGAPPTVSIKRKRGRQPKNRSVPIQTPPLPPPPPVPVNTKSSNDDNDQTMIKYPTTNKPSLPARQGVRRRIPRRFSGVASRIKREKLDPGSNDVEHQQDDQEMLALFDADLGSEALSEMSVRGLDLFKYASVEDGVYKCIACEKLRIPKTFKNKYSFQRHAFLYHEGNMRKVFPCPVCSREFSRPDKMKNHLRSVHENKESGGGSGSNGHSPANDDSNTVLVKGTELHENCDF